MNKSEWSSVLYGPNNYLCEVSALGTVESARTKLRSFSH